LKGPAVREALHADAERAPQLPMEWIGPTTSRVTDDGMDVPVYPLEFDDGKPVRRWRRPAWTIAAAAVMAIVVAALVLAIGDDDPTRQVASQPTTVAPPTTVAQPAAVAQTPVEVSLCTLAGPEVHPGTEETVVVPVSDGEMTILQRRGKTWALTLMSVTDPRLSGTMYHTSNADVYTLPGNEAGPDFAVATDRIENDEGAWQGSLVQLAFPDGHEYLSPLVMTGEGAYEGLTAILANVDPPNDCTMEGYIIEGTIPAAPEPQTGGLG
jgi:hypothetical protein